MRLNFFSHRKLPPKIATEKIGLKKVGPKQCGVRPPRDMPFRTLELGASANHVKFYLGNLVCKVWLFSSLDTTRFFLNMTLIRSFWRFGGWLGRFEESGKVLKIWMLGRNHHQIETEHSVKLIHCHSQCHFLASAVTVPRGHLPGRMPGGDPPTAPWARPRLFPDPMLTYLSLTTGISAFPRSEFSSFLFTVHFY